MPIFRPCPTVAQAGGVDHMHRHALDLDGIIRLTTSRVVPGTGVTMASSAPASALSSELLPALAGWRSPPDASRSKCSGAPGASRRINASVSRFRAALRIRLCKSRSLPKSSVASTSMRWDKRVAQHVDSPRIRPDSDRLALRAAASVLASIRSAMASAAPGPSCVFRKASCGELARPGHPQADPGTRLQTAPAAAAHHHPPWPEVPAHLTGQGGARKVQRQALVDRATVRGQERQVGGPAPGARPQTARRDHRRKCRCPRPTMPTEPRPGAVAMAGWVLCAWKGL